MIEITFTEKFRKFDSSMVGKTAFETDSVAENLLRKGFAIKKEEYAQLKDENYISPKGLRLCNNIIKNKINRVSKGKKDKITAYMATFPSREENVEKAVDSLIKQVDELVLVCNGDIKIKQRNKLSIYRTDELIGDVGCAGKFIFAYEWNGYVLTVDDDFIYPDDYVEKTIANIEKYNRECAISWHGRINDYPIEKYKKGYREFYQCTKNVDSDKEVGIIGTGVLGFHSDIFNENKYDIIQMRFTNCSDIYMSMAFDSRDIKMIVPEHKGNWLCQLKNTFFISYGNKFDNFLTNIINSYNWKKL